MSVNAHNVSHQDSVETANIATTFRRTCDFKDGTKDVKFIVEVKYGDTIWTTDGNGNINGLSPSSPQNIVSFLLTGQEYLNFATRKLTDAEKEMCVGELIPIWLDEAIAAHVAALTATT